MDRDKLIVRILLAIIGLIICGIGISFILLANLGADPISVFYTGVSISLNISYGLVASLFNLSVIVLIFFIDKNYISIASFLAMIFIGYTVDVVSPILEGIISLNNIMLNFIFLITGILLMAFGIALYLNMNLGVSAADVIPEIISNKLNLSYRLVRIVIDGLFVLFGYILGGKLGIGTIIATILLGPCIQTIRESLLKNNNIS